MAWEAWLKLGVVGLTTPPDRDRDSGGRPRFAGPRDRFGRPLPAGRADEHGDRDGHTGLAPAEALVEAVRLFGDERYYEAHELFEYLWKHPQVRDGERPKWKAMAQVAVGRCHLQRENFRGARALFDRAERSLSRLVKHGSRESRDLAVWLRRARTGEGRLGLSAGSAETIVFLGEEHVEAGQGAVAARDVAL